MNSRTMLLSFVSSLVLICILVKGIILSHVSLILFSCVLFRDLSSIHLILHTVKAPLVFVVFYVLEHDHEIARMQDAEMIVMNLPFGLR